MPNHSRPSPTIPGCSQKRQINFVPTGVSKQSIFCCLNLNGFQLLITPQNVFKTLNNYILFFIPAKVIYLATIILEKKMGKPITWQPPHRYWDIMIFYLDIRVMPHYSARYKDHLGGYCCYLLSQVTHSADCVWVGCHYYYRASVITK